MIKLLELDNVSLSYYSLKKETKALQNVSFNIFEGEFVSIVGPSGCGKTTILSLITSLIKPSGGKIKTKKDTSFGYMFQKDLLFDWQTILQNICIGLNIQKKLTPENVNYAKSLAIKYGLKDFLNSYPKELSGGMRQRTALIRTLALRPDILLLDEPFSALDFQTRLNVCDDVSTILKQEQKTALLVTHDINEAISLSDKVIVLSKRPATIKKIVDINLNKEIPPMMRRKEKKFNYYFDEIWSLFND